MNSWVYCPNILYPVPLEKSKIRTSPRNINSIKGNNYMIAAEVFMIRGKQTKRIITLVLEVTI